MHVRRHVVKVRVARRVVRIEVGDTEGDGVGAVAHASELDQLIRLKGGEQEAWFREVRLRLASLVSYVMGRTWQAAHRRFRKSLVLQVIEGRASVVRWCADVGYCPTWWFSVVLSFLKNSM